MSETRQLRLAQESIAGLRPYQEDSVLTRTLSDGRTLIAVADGMGGHAAGEVASNLALETLVESLGEGQDLDAAFLLANERVHAKSSEPGKEGMGTTLVVMLVEEDRYLIGNVGDSRAYVLSSAGIRRITEDHSYVAEAVKRGQSESDATASEWRDVLTRAIGTDVEVDVDVFGPFPVEDDTAVLLCSDGLYKALSDEDLQKVFTESGGPPGAAQSLVTAALEQGSDDNISVAIAEFGEVPRNREADTVAIKWPPPGDSDEAEVDTAEMPIPNGEGGEAETVSTEIATRRGPPMGVIGAVIAGVLLVVAYLVFSR